MLLTIHLINRDQGKAGADRVRIQRVEKEIAECMDMRSVERLCSIPGVDMITAWTLLAELGIDMSVFESPRHAASWARTMPGQSRKRRQAFKQSHAQG